MLQTSTHAAKATFQSWGASSVSWVSQSAWSSARLTCLEPACSSDRMPPDSRFQMSLEFTVFPLSLLNTSQAYIAVARDFLAAFLYLLEEDHDGIHPDLWYIDLLLSEVENFKELESCWVAKVIQHLIWDVWPTWLLPLQSFECCMKPLEISFEMLSGPHDYFLFNLLSAVWSPWRSHLRCCLAHMTTSSSVFWVLYGAPGDLVWDVVWPTWLLPLQSSECCMEPLEISFEMLSGPHDYFLFNLLSAVWSPWRSRLRCCLAHMTTSSSIFWVLYGAPGDLVWDVVWPTWLLPLQSFECCMEPLEISFEMLSGPHDYFLFNLLSAVWSPWRSRLRCCLAHMTTSSSIFWVLYGAPGDLVWDVVWPTWLLPLQSFECCMEPLEISFEMLSGPHDYFLFNLLSAVWSSWRVTWSFMRSCCVIWLSLCAVFVPHTFWRVAYVCAFLLVGFGKVISNLFASQQFAIFIQYHFLSSAVFIIQLFCDLPPMVSMFKALSSFHSSFVWLPGQFVGALPLPVAITPDFCEMAALLLYVLPHHVHPGGLVSPLLSSSTLGYSVKADAYRRFLTRMVYLKHDI